MKTYIIYYTSNNEPEAYEVYGYKMLKEAVKWLHSEEVNATSISIFKHGKNFEKDQDDVLECYKQWWK